MKRGADRRPFPHRRVRPHRHHRQLHADPSGGLEQGFLDGRPILDVELSVGLGQGATLSVGGQNVLDTYSQESVIANIVGKRYSEYMPWGHGGAYHYARVGYDRGD